MPSLLTPQGGAARTPLISPGLNTGNRTRDTQVGTVQNQTYRQQRALDNFAKDLVSPN